MDSPEDDVRLSITAPSFPPAFNNAPVVAKKPEVLAWFTKREDSTDEELEANCFGPPDVSSLCIPSWDELPSSPAACDDDSNSTSGTGIREGAVVLDATRTRDSARKFLVAEGVEPPLEVVLGISGWVVWSERTRSESSQHGLQAGEVSAPGCCHKAGV